jgi:hypothetical protein
MGESFGLNECEKLRPDMLVDRGNWQNVEVCTSCDQKQARC